MTPDEEKAEEYAEGKAHEHYHFLFEENNGSPIDFAKLCYLDGLAEGGKEKQKIVDTQTVAIESRDVWLAEKESIIIRQQTEIRKLEKENKIKEEIIIGEQKEIAELKEQISVLLSCSNCKENKGGYICEKEYNDKCLAQKIEYIKELKEENEELSNSVTELTNSKTELENKVTELEEQIENYQLAENESKEIIAELKDQIEKMKEILSFEEYREQFQKGERTLLGKTINEWLIYQNENERLIEQVEDWKADHEHNLELMKGLNGKITELKMQIEKMESFIHSEIDFCMYCPLTTDCLNDEGTCPYAGTSEDEQKKLLTIWILNKWEKEE